MLMLEDSYLQLLQKWNIWLSLWSIMIYYHIYHLINYTEYNYAERIFYITFCNICEKKDARANTKHNIYFHKPSQYLLQ